MHNFLFLCCVHRELTRLTSALNSKRRSLESQYDQEVYIDTILAVRRLNGELIGRASETTTALSKAIAQGNMNACALRIMKIHMNYRPPPVKKSPKDSYYVQSYTVH